MSLSLWLGLVGAKWNGRQDAQAALPETPGPNPYYEYLARKGHRVAAALRHRFERQDQISRKHWIHALHMQQQAEQDLPALEREAAEAQREYDRERARDQGEAQALNPPGRAYIPVGLYWVLLGLLIAGDAAISYTAFLTIGDLLPWLVGALALMVVVAMVVIGHVIGDRLRHGTAGVGTKVVLVLVVVVISVVMTLFREQAQQTVAAVTGSTQIEAITIDGPAPAPVGSAPAVAVLTTWESPMFLLVTMMGMVVPAILAYYVERRPRLLQHWGARFHAWRDGVRLNAGRRRLLRANRQVAVTRTQRSARYAQAQARLDEARDDSYWLMSAYARANMRRRGIQELPPSLAARPVVPGREILPELDWTEGSAA